jgi:DNA-binding MarR family transcriptional regulator
MSRKDNSCYEELLRAIAYGWLFLRQRGKKMIADLNYDLTFEQVFVLQILEKEDGLKLGVLAEKADRERTTMSRMVDGLERRNLAIRVPDKYDKRQKLVYLTKLGRKRNEEMIHLIDKFVEMFFRRVNKKQVESTLETLQLIFADKASD